MRLPAVVVCLYLAVPISGTAAPPSHCDADEVVVWSCATRHKVYSLCSSRSLTQTSGFLQYRAGPPGHPTFLFPISLAPPRGHFTAALLPRAVRVSFVNDDYLYEIFDPLVGEASILVSKGRRRMALIECSDSTHTLTENDILKSLGAVGGDK